MMHFNQNRHPWNEAESRLLYFAITPSPEMDGLQQSMGSFEEMKKWENTKGSDVEKMSEYFMDNNISPVRIADIEQYLSTTLTTGAATDELRKLLNDKKSNVAQDRIEAEAKIQIVVHFLNEKSRVIKETREKLRKMRGKPDSILEGKSIENTFGAVTNQLGAYTDAFIKAEFKDKAIMLAGATAAFLVARSMWNYFDGKWSKRIKRVGFFAGAGLLSIMALDAVNRTSEKMYGKPLISTSRVNLNIPIPFTGNRMRGSIPYPNLPIGNTKEDWRAQVHEKELAKIAEELRDTEIPDSFLSALHLPTATTTKHMKGLVNIMPYTVTDFRDLYDNHRAGKTIPKGSPEYRSKFKDDGMTDVERFALVETIGKTLGLVDANGNFISGQKFVEKKDRTILYLSLDF